MEDLQTIARKYLNMLPKGSAMPLPQILVENSPESDWNGIAIWEPKREIKGTVKIQKRCMDDTRTVERLIAHEICHHWQHYRIYEEGEGGVHRSGHSPASYWYAAAQIINELEGDDNFITEESDASYVTKNDKQFYVMIMKNGKHEYGWIWFSRVTERLRRQLEEIIRAVPVAIVKTDRDAFLSSNAKLPRIAIPSEEDESMSALLAATYDMYARKYSEVELPNALINAKTMG